MKLALTYDDVYITPKYSDIEHRSECSLISSLKTTQNELINFDIPIISSPMATITEIEMIKAMNNVGGLGIIHRFIDFDVLLSLISSLNVKNYGVSIGIKDDALKKAVILYTAGAKIILIDVANGHHKLIGDLLKSIRKELNKENYVLMAGNVATAEGAQFLYECGATAVRVGIGGGAVCETRVQTGIGIPMITSLENCIDWNEKNNNCISIIADGGIKYAGDVAKALAIGADMVMLGSMLSGAKETPGKLIKTGTAPYEKLYKEYQGSASFVAKLNRNENSTHIEGNSTIVAYKGKIKRIIQSITDGVQSSMSYVGARNLLEFKTKADFVRTTNAGNIEALPHLLLK